MINSIHIKGFRGIESGSITKFRQFNIFVGANNAGKSAVMEALYLASTANQEVGLIRETEDGQLSDLVMLSKTDLLGNNPLKIIAGKHGDLSDLANLSRIKEAFLIVNVTDSKSPLQEFELDIGKSKLSTEDIALFTYKFFKEPENEKKDDIAQLIWQDVDDLIDGNHIVFCWYSDLTYYNKGSANWLIKGQLPASQHTFFCDTSIVQSYIPITFYRRVLNEVPGWTQRIARHFGTIFEIEDPFTVQFVPILGHPEKLQGWIAREDKPALSIDAFGDGARAAFKLLAPLIVMAEMVTSDAPGLLLWEEPEAFQNPKTLGNLLREVVKIIRDKPIQVFIATHNLELIAYITQMLETQDLDPEATMLFHLSLSDGKLKSSRFDQETLVTWIDSGIDPRAWKDFVSPLQFQLQEK
ncbi:ATP-binding protein [Cronbergia sp. UHCC 0137]|uniref:ATP-binding protein n=1 Tax=Cronbergia sp. UHCC 0137 TaxID=3110239 RepID=UPI002B202301|nr:ATP-binding protein [Cronbergia sp. UHCC 0137]MEA5617954.1 ATP-binding protein [Cronbergia sp. UHCC 0137]